HDETNADGWFESEAPLDTLDEVEVLNVGQNTNSHEVPRASWVRDGEAWQVPLAIGPTFRLHLHGVEGPLPVVWEARVSADPSGWHSVQRATPPWLRYGAPLDEPEDGEPAWIEVRSEDGRYAGRAEVQSLVGVQDVEIECGARALLVGRVVDSSGRPVSS